MNDGVLISRQLTEVDQDTDQKITRDNEILNNNVTLLKYYVIKIM